MPRLHNRVLPALFVAAAAAMSGSGFVALSPNRLVSGRPIGLFAAAPVGLSTMIAMLGMVLLGSALVPQRRGLCRVAAVLACGLLLAVLAAAGEAASSLAGMAPGIARVSLGAAFWILLGAAGLAAVDGLQRVGAGVAERLVFVLAVAVAVAALAMSGLFDALSLAREYHARAPAFAAAVGRHIVLVAASVGPALVIGLPLGVYTARRPRAQGPVFAVLNLLQTIPSIALFGLLIEPLSAVATAFPALGAAGIGGIGVAPAIIALILYALLPIVRNAVAGITGVDPAALDAARGMGMTRRQTLWQVELPLALPMLLAGLRIVTVQAIGLAVVAALIGAGGLGTFVFQGLGQDATDLVLLGAVPAILLALIADFLLQTISALAVRRLGR